MWIGLRILPSYVHLKLKNHKIGTWTIKSDLLFSDVPFWEILLNMCIIQNRRYLLDCLHLFCVMVPIAQFARFVQGQCYQIIAILKKWSIVPQLIFLHSNFTLNKCTIFLIVAVFESKFTQFYFGKLDLLSNFIFQGVGSGNNNLVHRERQKIISLHGLLPLGVHTGGFTAHTGLFELDQLYSVFN